MDLKGRPGRTIEAQTLKPLDPETIFISSFLSNSSEAFLEECRNLKLDVPAVREGRVYTSPVPASDFGQTARPGPVQAGPGNRRESANRRSKPSRRLRSNERTSRARASISLRASRRSRARLAPLWEVLPQ